MYKNNNTTFSTDSFLLASYLLSESCNLLSLDKTNPKRIIFIFQETEKRQKLTQKFHAFEALSEPHRLASAQKDLKQMIYQKQNSER